MANTIADFYTILLADPTPISAQLQRQIFGFAQRHRNDPLMVTLQHRPDLDPDVDELLGAVASPAVQSAHVSRPGRDFGELSRRALKDRRVAVHQHLAKYPNLSNEAYAVMAKSSSLKVATALAQNPAAPLDARTTALYQVILRAPSGTYAEKIAATTVMRGCPELAPAAFEILANFCADLRKKKCRVPFRKDPITNSDALLILRQAFAVYLTDGAPLAPAQFSNTDVNNLSQVLIYCTNLVVEVVENDRNRMTPYYLQSHGQILKEIFAHIRLVFELPNVKRTRRSNLATVFIEHHETLETIEGASRADAGITQLTLDIVLATSPSDSPTSPTWLARQGDPNVLLEAVSSKEIHNMPAASQPAALAALFENPNTPLEALRGVIDLVGYRNRRDFALKHVSRADVVALLLTGNTSLFAGGLDSLLEKANSPEDVLIAVIEYNNVADSAGILKSKYLTENVVRAMPLSWVERIATNPQAALNAASVVRNLFVSAFGDNTRAWDLLEALMPTTPGTVDQMIGQVQALLKSEGA